MGRGDLAGAAHRELVSGVAQRRPEDAVVEVMLNGWRAQQTARGLQDFATMEPRERWCADSSRSPMSSRGTRVRLIWMSGLSRCPEKSIWRRRQSATTQTDLRLFSEYLCDGRYGWAIACEQEFGPGVHPVAICHEWNTIAHLNDYEGSPEARPLIREELQRFLDYADDQVDRAVCAKRKGSAGRLSGRDLVQGGLWVGASPHRNGSAGPG